MSSTFESIKKGMEEALAYLRGERVHARRHRAGTVDEEQGARASHGDEAGSKVSERVEDADHLVGCSAEGSGISLSAVIEGIHAIDDEVRGFLNVRTGRVVMLPVDDLDAAGNPPSGNANAREVLRSDDYRELPDQFEIDDYSIMQRFCEAVDDDALRRGLLRSIQGRGASMRIRHTVREYGVEEAWSAFRKAALRPVAIEWLEIHELDYADE